MTLESLVVEPKQEAIGSVIWLHGLGADGHDFINLVPQLKLGTDLPLRFIFPHAPIRPVTLNANMEMRAWFDIHDLDETALANNLFTTDEEGINASQAAIIELIEAEIAKGVPCEKIILAGFSQGGSMALYTGLHYDKPLAGLLALSTCLPFAQAIESHNKVNAKTPILLIHGTYDPVITLKLARTTFELLKKSSLNVQMSEYPMEHQLCLAEVIEIASWIKKLY